MASKRILSALIAGIAGVFLIANAVPAKADMRAAKKEGKVVWYSSLGLPIAQAVCKLFNKKKLGITCELNRTGSGKLYRRYLQESKGGLFRADVYHSSNLGHFMKMKKKYLLPYRPKGTKKFNPDFQTKHAAWTILRSFIIVPAYNTRKVKASEVPKSWKDILNPRWKGKLTHAHPSYSGGVTIGMIAIEKMYGWEYYKKLAALKPVIVQSGNAVFPLVSRGEVDIAASGASYVLFNAIKRGEPIKTILPKEGVPFIVSPNSVLKKAPHPNAAKVFTDFLFTFEVQQLLANNSLYVGHPDVKYPKDLPRLKDFKLIIVPPAEIKKKTKPMRKKFRKTFGV